METKRRLVCVFFPAILAVFAIGGIAPGPAFAQDTAKSEGNIPVIAVFPYFCPDPVDAKDLAWAVFAVHDMVRERLLSGNRFVLSEKTELAEKAMAAGLSGDYYMHDESRLAVARESGADFLTWGYILKTEKGLRVFHGLADVASGRTMHIESALLPEDKTLIPAMEQSVLSFEEWSKNELPEKIIPPVRTEVVIVEKEIRTPTKKIGFSLSPSVGVLTHPWIFRDSLASTPTLGLLLSYTPKGQRFFDFGLNVSCTLLREADPESQKIEIVMLPIMLSSGANIPLFSFLDLGFVLSGGACFIFGRVNMEFLSYARPAAAIESSLILIPLRKISVTVGTRILYVFNSYANQSMIAVEPKMGMHFKF